VAVAACAQPTVALDGAHWAPGIVEVHSDGGMSLGQLARPGEVGRALVELAASLDHAPLIPDQPEAYSHPVAWLRIQVDGDARFESLNKLFELAYGDHNGFWKFTIEPSEATGGERLFLERLRTTDAVCALTDTLLPGALIIDTDEWERDPRFVFGEVAPNGLRSFPVAHAASAENLEVSLDRTAPSWRNDLAEARFPLAVAPQIPVHVAFDAMRRFNPAGTTWHLLPAMPRPPTPHENEELQVSPSPGNGELQLDRINE